ncbi:Protein CBG25726 [Caenorhabditis briggsae]|uniref:Protein CBG25726 n=1 Tax=Caenorhabditis briggsae TaxID=6238 RepID=B6IGY9_CAEBR|nr:Protein CBG25726 [Caenorhabditis briggsae]CAR99169.1 Protein CBG25726 [Caenorhabditis briggsae]
MGFTTRRVIGSSGHQS